MADVKVTNITSLLEIAFAMNLIFVLFELKPVFDEGFNSLEVRFAKTLNIARRMLNYAGYVRLTLPSVMYRFLEFVTLIWSGTASVVSFAYLVGLGLDPNLSMTRMEFWGLLLILFVPTPLYYVLVLLLLAFAIGLLRRAAKDWGTLEKSA